MEPSARLLTPAQLNLHLGKQPSACSRDLGWPWMRVESWRKPTGLGEMDCPAGTHHELIIPLKGSSTTLRRFGNTQYESTDGTLLNEFDLIPRGHENFWRWEGIGCEYASIDITPGFLQRIAEEDEDFRTPGFGLMPIAGGTDPRIRSIAVALVIEMEDQGASGRLFAETLMTALAARLLRRCTVQSPTMTSSRGFPRRMLAQIVDLIEANISHPVGLQKLADAAGCSTWAFCRRFKLTTGVSPYQFVLLRRIDRSKILLRQSTQSLSQIALATGFSSHAHFSSTFLRQTGLTPATYRRESRVRKYR